MNLLCDPTSCALFQVILENIRSMKRTLTEIEHYRTDLGLPSGAEDTLVVFQRNQNLQQPMQELEERTQEQSTMLEASSQYHHLSTLECENETIKWIDSLFSLIGQFRCKHC